MQLWLRVWLLTALLVGATAPAAAAPTAAGNSAAETGLFDRSRTHHFLLLYDVAFEHRTGRDGSGRFERELLRCLETTRRDLGKRLGLAPRHRIVVTVHDPARFDRVFASLFRFPSAGFFREQIHVRGANRVTPRLAAVLAHELVHAAFHQRSPSLPLPGWLNEGVAMWFEARSRGERGLSNAERHTLIAAAERGAWLPLEELSTPSFARFSPRQARLAYLQSHAMVEHLVALRGERALRAWIGRLLRSGNIERTLKRQMKLGVSELDRSVRESLDLSLRPSPRRRHARREETLHTAHHPDPALPRRGRGHRVALHRPRL